MCCVCQAVEQELESESEWGENHDWYELCENSANGATDSWGDGCEWYDSYPDACGEYDTNEFSANDMCCACSVTYSDWESAWEESFEEDLSDFDSDWFSYSESEYEQSEEYGQSESESFVEIVDSDESEIDWNQVEYDALEDFEEEDWQNFVEETVDPFNPMVDWNEIGDHLEEFQDLQELQDSLDNIDCDNTEYGLTDDFGNACDFYEEFPASCGDADNREFVAA